MAKKVVVIETKPICPHCNEPISSISWFPFADGAIMLICCGLCKKVIGAK